MGVVAALFWVLALVGSAFGGPAEGEEDAVLEAVGVVTLVTANVAAVVVAFVRERIGSRLLAITGLALAAFAVVSAGRHHLFAAAVSGGPFLVSGILLMLAARGAEPHRDEAGDRGSRP